MKQLLPVLCAVILLSCSRPQEEKSNSDSTAIGVWEAPEQLKKLTSEVTIYKKESRIYLYEAFNDKSIFNEEMISDTIDVGIQLNYRLKGNGFSGEYLIIYKDSSLGWFSEDGREFAKTEKK